MKFTRRIVFLAIGLICCIALTACDTVGDPNPSRIELLASDTSRDMYPAVDQDELDTVVSGLAGFTLDLYEEVIEPDENLIFSTYSMSVALAMTYAGARGETAAEIADVFGFALGQSGTHRVYNHLDITLESREENPDFDSVTGFRLRTANSIWGQKGEAFMTGFLDTLALHYGAGLRLLDFASAPEPCRLTINEWVEDQTEERIEDLLTEGSITAATRLVLTNAIYFKAAWNLPFDEDNTINADFHLVDESVVSVPMMQQTDRFRYASGSTWSAIELPYDGEQLSMVIIVPDDLGSFEERLSVELLDTITNELSVFTVDLSFPSFSIRSQLDLKQPLTALGMPTAFTDLADFTGIRESGGLAITDVLHQAFIAVDEEGTEAAAATAVVIGETSMPQFVELSVDSPFLFLIRDIPTGTILFFGRVVDPSE